ncbi:hypothetical protein [Bacillus sp. T3]|uniref:FAD binding domain-containing protein n=1 Tax=Bacillus sp. T3 TaxID=467262 RepID=UPI002981ED41|nr:hypothetical protein [Bacillus sp. T3]
MVEIRDFIQGPRRVQRNQNELLVEIILPSVLNQDSHVVFEKVGNRNADAIAKVSFAGLIRISENQIVDVRFAFGAVGPTIVRSYDIEKKVLGKTLPLAKKEITAIIADFAQILNPIDDQRSTSVYRKRVALNLLRYFLESYCY